ncbi:MAG: molybdopterin molybdotransferase MoeA [Gammaproteobacteria bacterium]|nr:molybdopterin molybdotransferase MoeA [Gammaproteobacteria bacterium]MCW9004381.1 molybdopterin molybdotransferase MoeA [Gammaproteobacteria bacterium]
MNKQASCNDESDPHSLSFEQARERIEKSVAAVKGKRCVTIREALGRVLADDVCSPMNVPPFINSAMDGYAINADDISASGESVLKVTGKSFAGRPFEGSVNKGECVRIMTGAVVPQGADTVVMQEHAEVDGDNIKIGSEHKKGQNVRLPGDDFSTGDIIIKAGERLSPAKLGLLASVGVTEFNIIRTPVVAFFSTGDELKGVGQTLQPGDIYDSNRYILFGMLQKMGVECIDMGVIADIKEQIELTLKEAAAIADVVITSGGASVGEADYIKEILDEIGEVNFWKIAMKPGKPLAFGKINNALFFGLPGNPVSAMATFYQFVQPSIKLLEGEKSDHTLRLTARCLSKLKKRPGRKDFQRGIVKTDENNMLVVDTTGIQGSHMLSSMSKANCFIVLPAEAGDIEAGTEVEVQPFSDLI